MEKTAKKKKAKYPVRMTTGMFRAAFVNIWKPRPSMQGNTGDPKYSITMLFDKSKRMTGTLPKDESGEFKKIDLDVLIRNAIINEFGDDEDNWPERIQWPKKDGDAHEFVKYEGYKGHWAFTATAYEDSKPGVIDRDFEEIVDQDDFYPGCYARATVYAKYWTFGGKHGVKLLLDHVQKLKDGKRFGGKTPIANAFGPLADIDEADETEEMDFA
jgi:hypothetical protein